jgi:sugar lactone lactonase YvrE
MARPLSVLPGGSVADDSSGIGKSAVNMIGTKTRKSGRYEARPAHWPFEGNAMRRDRILFMLSRKIAVVLVMWIAGALGCASSRDSEGIEPLAFPAPPDQARFYWERTVIGTGDVTILGGEQKFRAFLTGESNRGGLAFAKPFDVAVHQGRVFISDTVRRSVYALDFVEHRSFFIGDSEDAGDLHKPLGVAVAGDGRLFVCDGQLRRILIYDRDGQYQRAIGDAETFERPSGIDVSPDGSRLFVIDTGGVDSNSHRLLIFDVESGESLRVIGMRGSEEGELNLPRDVGLGPDGLLYVSDGGNFRIQVFTQEGDFVRSWGEPGRHLGQFTRLKGLAVDDGGNVYAVDAAFGNFQIFNPTGQLLLFIGGRSTERGPARYMLPSGIDVDEDGRVYMIDQFFRKLEIYRPAGLQETEGYLAGATPPSPAHEQGRP